MANAVINLTTSAGLSTQQQEYCDKKLLMEYEKRLVYATYAKKIALPLNQGNTWQGRIYQNLDDVDVALDEGVNPDGLLIDQDEVTATVVEWGAFVEATSLLKKTSFDPIAWTDTMRLLGRNAKDTTDRAYMRVLATAGTVQYAADALQTSDVATGDLLTIDEIQRAVRTLNLAEAPMYTRSGSPDHYVCIVGPYAVYDLRNDEDWLKPHEYVDTKNIYSGELGMHTGVVFVQASNYMVEEDAGAGNPAIDVHSSIVFGEEAYGGVYLGGAQNVRSIINNPGSSGSADPLAMLGTAAWKVDGFVPVILHDDWMVRIEHAVSA